MLFIKNILVLQKQLDIPDSEMPNYFGSFTDFQWLLFYRRHENDTLYYQGAWKKYKYAKDRFLYVKRNHFYHQEVLDHNLWAERHNPNNNEWANTFDRLMDKYEERIR